MTVIDTPPTTVNSHGLDAHDDEAQDVVPYELGELFYSLTNKSGHIQACNDVFVRVSEYSLDDLLGQPHSIVRHPDMPRAVFKVLWDNLHEGKPLAAYVKNLAADGRHYWVLAMATPAKNGYLSIRLKPSTSTLRKVTGLYAQVRSHEISMENAGAHRSEVLKSSVPRLLEGLQKLGFEHYHDFETTALPAEIRSRRAGLEAAGHMQEHVDYNDAANGLERANSLTLHWISGVFDQLDTLTSTSSTLVERSHFLHELARSIHIFALNAGIASSRLGREGAALVAVTGELQGSSKEIVRTIERATTDIERAIRLAREVGFNIAISTLQAEMVEFVMAENGGAGQGGTELRGRSTTHVLLEALAESVETVLELGTQVASALSDVADQGQKLFSLLDTLQFELLAGRIEIAQVQKSHGLIDMFSQVSSQILEASPEIAAFGAETVAAGALIEGFDLAKGRAALDELRELGK